VEHLSQEQLEDLVMGVASPDDEDARRHLAACAECARRLAWEARLESDLHDAMATVPDAITVVRGHPVRARLWRVALPVAAALAIVIAGVRLLAPRQKLDAGFPSAETVEIPPANLPGLGGSRMPMPGECALPAQDVCRFVTVEAGPVPPR
jgi:hypothetical protein